jgi:hypothetical protein
VPIAEGGGGVGNAGAWDDARGGTGVVPGEVPGPEGARDCASAPCARAPSVKLAVMAVTITTGRPA